MPFQKYLDKTNWGFISEYEPLEGRDFDQYFEQVADNYRGLSSGIKYYQDIISQLAKNRKLTFLPMYEFVAQTSETRCCSIRHDVDADPLAAITQARYLARIGLPSSFYLLHSAVYYGEFYNSVFVRNPALKKWIIELIVTGAEIGLHNDALGVCFRHSVDPYEVLSVELDWLRANGALIRGTVAHNSYSAQRGENYELFTENLLTNRKWRSADKKKWKIGARTMSDFGLEYEGTFARPLDKPPDVAWIDAFTTRHSGGIHNRDWMHSYLQLNEYCRWDVDSQIWFLGNEKWVISDLARPSNFTWNCEFRDVLAYLEEAAGDRTMLVLHPEYFGDY